MNTTEKKDYASKIPYGFTPARRIVRSELPTIKPQRRRLGPIDAALESHKTRENTRNAVMKNYFESKQLVSFNKHLDVMKAVYFEKMKREKLRVGRSLWELEQKKRKIMRQIYEHPRTDINNSRNPALFYFTQEKARKKSRKRENKEIIGNKT